MSGSLAAVIRTFLPALDTSCCGVDWVKAKWNSMPMHRVPENASELGWKT
jgi:hypothetical protein